MVLRARALPSAILLPAAGTACARAQSSARSRSGILLDPGTCAPHATAFSAGMGRPHQTPLWGCSWWGSSQKAPVSLLMWQKITQRGALGSREEMLRCHYCPHPTHPQLQSLGGNQFWPPVSILLPLLFRQEYRWRLPGVSSEIF